MSRDRRKIIFLNKIKSCCDVFEGSETTRVLGSGYANLSEERKNEKDVWIIEGLKHNILSVIQMVDGGKEGISKYKGSIIRKEGSKRVISKGVKTSDNVYVLNIRVKSKKRPREYSSSSDFE